MNQLLDRDWLRDLCLQAGADDVGFISAERSEVSDQLQDLLEAFPRTKMLISYICRMNREPVRISYGANYKAAYCMAVCPAGEDVIGPYLQDRKGFVQDIVRPLQEKVETVYVTKDSDADHYVRRRFPHKIVKQVGNGLRLNSIRSFVNELPRAFQPKRSAGLNATYHFSFTGAEARQVTVSIREQRLSVLEGHQGHANIQITADSKAWLAMLSKEQHIAMALLRRKIRIKGSPKLLISFGKCFSI